MSAPAEPPTAPAVLSFRAVRRALGLLGLALPAALYAYGLATGDTRPSISAYYHTAMGDVLTGSLVAIGIFLVAYRGYPRQPGERLSDRVVSGLAGPSVIIVALVPAAPEGLCPAGAPAAGTVRGFTFHWCDFVWIHFAAAVVFFACLAVFCFFLFPRGDRHPDGGIDRRAPRNRIYLTCGRAIVAALVLLLLYWQGGAGVWEILRPYDVVFWLETVAIVAFAISWLVKGGIR